MGVLLTCTVNVCLWPVASVALDGDRTTLIAVVKVIVALAKMPGLALLWALTVTEPFVGCAWGAV